MYRKTIICVLLTLIALSGCLTLRITAAEKQPSVNYPTSSLKSGTYYLYELTKIYPECKTADADIYYSINSGKYKLYKGTKGIPITANTNLKMYALKNGIKSKTVLYKYRFKPKFKISHSSGTYDGAQTVTLKSVTSNIDYYYTLDGTQPDVYSPRYTSKGIFIDESCTLRILAVKKNWTNVYFKIDLKIRDDNSSVNEIRNLLYDYKSKYGYNALTETQQRIYESFYEMAEKHLTKLDVYNLRATDSDISSAYWAFDYDNPQFFWIGHGYGGKRLGTVVESLHLDFSRNMSESKNETEKFTQKAAELIQEAMQYTDTVERIKFIHDSIIVGTEYTNTNNNNRYIYEADGPLVYGQALCEGYSKAFMYICQASGIECICISNPEHTWNMVKIKNRWYHIDLTYDDIESLNSMCGYDYFLLSTSTMLSQRNIQCFYPIPEAVVDYKHNYK